MENIEIATTKGTKKPKANPKKEHERDRAAADKYLYL
jgi:hypothetical protein